MAKITKATVKSFMKKYANELYLKTCSYFDGQIDGTTSVKEPFSPIVKTDRNLDRTLGIQGAWFVGSSRDYFNSYNDGKFEGFEVSNCCGHFVLAKKI